MYTLIMRQIWKMNKPKTVESAKKMLTTAMSLSYALY